MIEGYLFAALVFFVCCYGMGRYSRWLEREDLLAPELILGHAIYLDHHPATRLRTADDLARLAAHGVTVAHCPVSFARAGVRVAIGTDTSPFDMLAETREAILAARITAGGGPGRVRGRPPVHPRRPAHDRRPRGRGGLGGGRPGAGDRPAEPAGVSGATRDERRNEALTRPW